MHMREVLAEVVACDDSNFNRGYYHIGFKYVDMLLSSLRYWVEHLSAHPSIFSSLFATFTCRNIS